MQKLTQKELDLRLKILDGPGSPFCLLLLREMDLRGLNFKRADLTNVDMSGSDARGANFMGCTMPPDMSVWPEMLVGDSWGSDYYGDIDKAQEAANENA